MSQLPNSFPSEWEIADRSPEEGSAEFPSFLEDPPEATPTQISVSGFTTSDFSPSNFAPSQSPDSTAKPSTYPPGPGRPADRSPLDSAPPLPTASSTFIDHLSAAKFQPQPGNEGEFVLGVYDGKRPRCYILSGHMYSLGRDSGNDIPLANSFVSRRHAYLLRIPNRNGSAGFSYCIVDGNRKGGSSTNGVLVNSKRIATHYLKSGDIIHFGPEVKGYYLAIAQVANKALQAAG